MVTSCDLLFGALWQSNCNLSFDIHDMFLASLVACIYVCSALGGIDALHSLQAPFRSDQVPIGTLRTRSTTVYRPKSLEAVHHARHRSLNFEESVKVDWEPVEVAGPDVTDRHTLAQLARMSGNAYALPGQKNWYEVDRAWSIVRLSYMQEHSLVSLCLHYRVFR